VFSSRLLRTCYKSCVSGPSARILLLILTAAEFGCQQKAAVPKPRYAVVRFENLSGDPSLDWAGRGASEFLSTSLASALDGPVLNPMALGRQAGALGLRPPGAPGLSTERASALLAGSTRLISGYIERKGSGIRVSAVVEDLTNGKAVRSESAENGSAFGALQSLSQRFSGSAKAYLTSDENVLRLYSTAVDEDVNHIDRREAELREALQSAPGFGPAWAALVQTRLFKGDRLGIDELIADARAHQLDPVVNASLEADAAQLKNDRAGVITAQRKLTALSPGDLVLLRGLAEREMAAGEFREAAADWKKLADVLVNDPAAFNSLGYARSYAGDYAGAMEALREYEKARPNDPNVQDSMGDLAYTYRKFGEAAGHYQQAFAKDPAFQRGGDLYKGAWAKFNAGDKTGADASLAQFKAVREKAKDPGMALLEADWLYRTGRQGAGASLLRKALEDPASNPQFRAAGWSQLAIWDLIGQDRPKAQADALASGQPTGVPMLIMRLAVLPSASTAEWQERAAKLLPEPVAAQIRRTALAYALVLDGKPKEALPVWQELAEAGPATDFFTRAMVDALRGRKPERALVPDPNPVNQFGALLNLGTR
jgi:tetratricopeptide (TPR) repeat protein/TolB-like protein